MEKLLEKLFDIKKIPAKLFFVIFISSALILFVPNKFLTTLNLKEFLESFGKFIGISFIVSSAFLIVTLTNFLTNLVKRRKFKIKIENSIINNLQNLNFHEKALLREFFLNNKTTLQLPFDDDTVVGLVNKHIIYQASSTGSQYIHGSYFPYSITKFAHSRLTNEIIDLPKDISETEKMRLINDKPTWAKEKSRFDN